MGWFYAGNPITWATFYRRGGWKSLWLTAAGYSALALVIIGAVYQFNHNPRQQREVLQGITLMIVSIQALALYLIGYSRISNTVRLDVTSKIIESHRLMPLRPTAAIFGYITGATPRVLVIALLNFVLGFFTSTAAGISSYTWLMTNAVLFGFATTLWATATLTAFIARGIVWIGVAIFLWVFTTSGASATTFPGIYVLCSPLHASNILVPGFGTPPFIEGLIVSQFLQSILAITFLFAASRKYAHDNALAFRIHSALILLFAWVGASAFGLYFDDKLTSSPHWGQENMSRAMFMGSASSALLLGCLVMSSAAWTVIARNANRRSIKREFVLPLICLVLCLAPILGLTFVRAHTSYSQWNFVPPTPTTNPAAGNRGWATNPGQITTVTNDDLPISRNSDRAAVIAASGIFMLQGYVLMRVIYPRVKRSALFLILALLFLWLVPLVVDAIANAISNHPANQFRYSVCSPLGILYAVSDDPGKYHYAMGLAYQAGMLLLIIILALGIARTRPPSRIPPLLKLPH